MAREPASAGGVPGVGRGGKLLLPAVLLLTLAALLLRVGFWQETRIDNPIRADARHYALYGYNIAHHGVFSLQEPGDSAPVPDSIRSPGYPALIALTMLIAGDEGFYPLLLGIQAVLSSLLVPLAFLAGLAFLPAWGALAGAALVALDPHLTASSGYVLTETLFAFLLAAAIASLCWAFRTERRGLFLLSGALAGGAYLVNQTFLPYPVLLGAGVVFFSRGARARAAKALALFLLPLLLAWGGWALRGATLPPGAVGSDKRAIMSVVHGSYPDWTYRTREYRFFPYREDPELPALTASWGGFLGIFAQRFSERPLRHLSWYLFEKPVWLWTWDEIQGQGDVFIYPALRSLYRVPGGQGSPSIPPVSPVADGTRVLMKLLNWPLVLLAAAGGVLLGRRLLRGGPDGSGKDFAAFAVVGLPLFYTALLVVFAPIPRYATPLRPFVYLGAAWAAAAFWGLLAGRGEATHRTSRTGLAGDGNGRG